MKNFRFFSREICSDKMFEYPLFNPNFNFLEGEKICVLGSDTYDLSSFFKIYGAAVLSNPSNSEVINSQIGVLLPMKVTGDTEEDYYKILDYYVEKLQLLIRELSKVDRFTHIVVVLPPLSDEEDISFSRMALYAVYGLIMGLGELNASKRVFINGILLSSNTNASLLKEWVKFLSSDNSNNIVGQIIKL